MMNIQPYYYQSEQQLAYSIDADMPKFAPCSNYNDFAIFSQFSYPPPFSTFPAEYLPEPELNSSAKPKKNRKNRNTDSKGLLPKTLESEKQVSEDPAQTQQQNEQLVKHVAPYQIFHFTQGAPMPKLQSDIVSNQEVPGSQQGSILAQKQKGQHQQTKKPKKEHINTGHWSAEEHSTYINFLQQYESIMTSSMMKKTSKIFKQMSELIGTRTPSQCRSHHQKFNPYALRGENGKRLPRTERSRAGRKKKNPQSEIPKAEEGNLISHYEQEQYLVMYDKQMFYPPAVLPYEQWNPYIDLHQNIKKEEDQDQELLNSEHLQQQMLQQQDYEEYLKINLQRNSINQDFIIESRNLVANEY